MQYLFTSSLIIALAAVGLYGLLRYLRHKREERRRDEGYKLIYWLNAYSAWVDSRRDEPMLNRSTAELDSPDALTHAREIKDLWFPELSQHMVRLLQAHSRLIEYLWQHSMLRLSQATGWRPAHRDPQYQQIRGAQEDLIEEMIAMCHEAIGDTRQSWRPTGTDFSFSNSGISLPGNRVTRA